MTKKRKPEIRETSRALPIALLRARETLMSPIRRMLAEIGLTEQKWRILRILEECGQLEQTAISQRACLLLPSVTRITQSLESQGLLVRSNDDTDKRKMMIKVTDEGRKIVRENMQLANEIYRKIETQLGRKKMDNLLDLLEELKDMEI